MTTIAWDGETLAADRQMSVDNLIVEVTKIFKVKCGRHGSCLVGMAGDASCCEALLTWIKRGMPSDEVADIDDEDTCIAIVVNRHGVWYVPNGKSKIKIDGPCFAIGTGAHFALAAMACGKNAKEAVEIASKLDTNSGVGVDVLTL